MKAKQLAMDSALEDLDRAERARLRAANEEIGRAHV